MFLDIGNALRMARLLLSQLLNRQPSNYETRSIILAIVNAWVLFYSNIYVPPYCSIAVSFNKCIYCKSPWIKASAKCPKCKCKCNVVVSVERFHGLLSCVGRGVCRYLGYGHNNMSWSSPTLPGTCGRRPRQRWTCAWASTRARCWAASWARGGGSLTSGPPTSPWPTRWSPAASLGETQKWWLVICLFITWHT